MPLVEPQVLTLIGAYSPSYKAGGPVRSVQNLVAAFGKEFHFRIVTLDRDLGDKLPLRGVVANCWVQVGDADVMYLRPGFRGLLRTWSLLRSADQATVLYLNSFFSRRFSMLAAVMWRLNLCRAGSLVLAPRGEFSPGALRFKRIRKLLYIRISGWLGTYRGIIWQASSELEASLILRQFPATRWIEVADVLPNMREKRESVIATASDLAARLFPEPFRSPKRPGRLRAVFLSRLCRIKNLSGAIRMLEGLSGEVAFDIYGPVEDPLYWKECQSLIGALPPNIRVRYEGEIENARVGQVFAEHDLFLFPTLGENYGHAIYEALASGCPILISDQTPWRNLEAEGVGWDIPLGAPERWRCILQQCVDGDDEYFKTMSERATKYAARRANDPQAIDANRKLFQTAFVRKGARDIAGRGTPGRLS